jgi:hypothetical protein
MWVTTGEQAYADIFWSYTQIFANISAEINDEMLQSAKL